MAAKRVVSSAVNWSALAERVPDGQKPMFLALKARSEGYLRRVLANPESAPKLDFAAYKKRVNPALVDSLQKQYEAFKVPYPEDKWSAQISQQEKEAASEVQKFIADSAARIQSHQQAIAKWDDVLPFEEMTLEDYKDAFPDQAIDLLRRPTFWPHNPEDQIGYKAKDEVAAH